MGSYSRGAPASCRTVFDPTEAADITSPWVSPALFFLFSSLILNSWKKINKCFLCKRKEKTPEDLGWLYVPYRYVWLVLMREVLSFCLPLLKEVSVDIVCVSIIFIIPCSGKPSGQVEPAIKAASWSQRETSPTRRPQFGFLYLQRSVPR